ncbi:DUF3102 domain-containing protein [Mesorhizobium sp. M7A.F.Ca.US.008.03.1.1]|uniref:DUF3102 domain-containing protein n=1 Tax=Mesorhizobium sp. M7A.F.Ca.US.008.03.1.1 TaxID=2496742 RepID=UPI000FCC5578|nr:DUF3102 domain-containing protein [Mesorhizobium sp. M7A.F.Ca.US.008.03.1.1]RUW62130.1 DUF3102 domain-containing protein [Mesorhizobium sp. M7A.F.Ca.US.008.03.1.1]
MTDDLTTLPVFNYAHLSTAQAKLAKEAAEFIGDRRRRMSTSVLEIGAKLNDVKDSLGHGHFTAWVESEFPMTIRTAQDYMLAAEKLGSKNEVTSYLPVTTLIEMAKAPGPVRDDLLHRIDEGQKLAQPLPVRAVNYILSNAKDVEKAAKEAARISPEAKAKAKVREKANKQRWARENEKHRQRREAEQKIQQRADYALAVLLISRFQDDLDTLKLAFEKARQHYLSGLLSNPYGSRLEGFRRVPNDRPYEWDDEA